MAITHIFSINTGRCGSDYLTELLAQATNTVSLHEGLPMMNGEPMQQFNRGHPDALRQLMPLKLREIDKQQQSGKIYCETNHSYIKGWGYLLPDTYIPQHNIGVVVLTRAVEKTIHSLLRVHEVPGQTAWSRTWYLDPQAEENLSAPPAMADRYGLCEWYVHETRLRAENYQRRFPQITYFECDLEQLNDQKVVLQMFERFGLLPMPTLSVTCGRPLNTRSEWPQRSLDELLAPAAYPSADGLPPAERAALLESLVAYLHQHYADDIRTAQPDRAMGGSLAPAVTQIVGHAQPELEAHGRFALAFTDTERILIGEFLRSIAPHDLMGLVATPFPGAPYRYDFNRLITLSTMVRYLGPIGLLKMLRMMASGIWGKDYSHRDDAA